MSGLTAFFRQNAKQTDNMKFAASGRFVDEKGNPMLWEIRALSGKEDENLRKACTKKIKTGRGSYTEEIDANLYAGKLAEACTVYPDLKNAELQGSYGVMGADDLLKTMLTPGEYADYMAKVKEVNGYDRDIEEMGEEVKNS